MKANWKWTVCIGAVAALLAIPQLWPASADVRDVRDIPTYIYFEVFDGSGYAYCAVDDIIGVASELPEPLMDAYSLVYLRSGNSIKIARNLVKPITALVAGDTHWVEVVPPTGPN